MKLWSAEHSVAEAHGITLCKTVAAKLEHEPEALIDKLIIGALIEARSCERFAALAPYLDEDIARYYVSLLRSKLATIKTTWSCTKAQ